jgi:aminocarboxymuconate-semialdehyde decarboxylase
MTDQINRYGLTAARQHGRPGREIRPASLTVDAHAHMLVREAAEFVRPHLPPDPQAQFEAEETRALNRQQGIDRHKHLTDLDQRLLDMDAMGLDKQIVSPAPGQCYYTVSPEIGIKAAQMVNDGVAEFTARRPDRLVPIGTVPLHAGAAAVEELERCMRKLGFRGVQILTNVAGKELSDPAYAAFWARAEALDALVMIHPIGFTEPRRLGKFYFNNVIGNPFDTMLALHHLIFEGVLERHPKLKLLAVHGGGYLPAYSGRIDHAWGARSDAHGALPQPPTLYLKRVYFDTIVFTPHQLEALVRLFGADHILMGTDYPYDMGEYDPIGHVASVTSLSESERAAIIGGNARRLYGL